MASSRRTAFGTGALTAALALWTSGAPSVVYPSYGREWSLPPALTTAVFGVYPVSLLLVLGLFGGISDRVGRRAAIVLGLALMAVGTLAFALAPSVEVLLVARAVTGVGVGFALSPATALLAEHARPGRGHIAGAVATASTAAGLTVALVLGGAFLALLPDPLHLSYCPLLAAVLLTLLLALRLPGGGAGAGVGVQLLRVERSLRGVVVQGALGVAAAYGTGGVVLALGADVAVGLLHTASPLVIGLVLALSAVTIGVTALLARGLRAASAAPAGAIGMVVGLAALVAASITGSLVVFLVSIVLTGIGYSLLFSAGVGVAAELAPAAHRASTVSAVYFAGYAVQALTAIGLGQLATAEGLLPAIATGAAVLATLAVIAGAAPFVRAHRAARSALEGNPA
ncbi:MFS transporter [Amnibacterium sp. CER49]|uniref:MFS transporter n=1 Tax=Amnibacterium sp. CER49 TaxID=3039161 RepID=UPI002447B614|nr:MFS transporter [Amnibacterium sp. CER49]MDH2443453.1 MFS transporter [Amnibacterium sp. CER49]